MPITPTADNPNMRVAGAKTATNIDLGEQT